MKLSTIFLLAVSAFAAGTVTQSGAQQMGTTGNWYNTFYWTGDATNGTVPTTGAQLSGCCAGYFLTQVAFVPGTPSPTSGYSVQLQDSTGVDLLAGQGTSLSATAASSVSAPASAPPISSFSLVIAGQSVASAKGTVIVYMQKPGTVNVAKLMNPTSAGGSSSGITNQIVVDGVTYPLTNVGLQNALNAGCSVGHAKIIIPSVTIVSAAEASINCSDIEVAGSGKGSKIVKAVGASAFNSIVINGTLGGPTALLNSTANEGDRTVTLVAGGVAAVGLAVGDYFVISINALAKQQVCQAMVIAGDVVTCSESMAETFTTGTNAFIQKFTSPAKRVKITNLAFDGSADANSADTAIGARAWADGEISDIWCTNMGGPCIYTVYGHNNRFDKITMHFCSNSVGYSDMYLWYETDAHVSNITSLGAGFGPTFNYMNHSTIYGLQSGGSNARGMKFNTSSHNFIIASRAENPASTFSGFELSGGSHNNLPIGFEGHNGTAGDLAFVSLGDANNRVIGGFMNLLEYNVNGGDPANNILHDVTPTNPVAADSTARASGNTWAGASPGTLQWGCTGTATASQTIFMYSWPPGACTGTVYTDAQTLVVPPGPARTIRNLVCNATAGGVNASSGSVAIFVNNTPTGIVGTFGVGTQIFDTTHRYRVQGGDNVIALFGTQGAETLANVRCSLDYQ